MNRRGMCLAGLAVVGLLVVAGMLVQAPVASSAWEPAALEMKAQSATADDTQPARGGTVVAILPSVTYTVYMPFVTVDPCSRAPLLLSPRNGMELGTLIPTMSFMRGTADASVTSIEIDDDPAFGSAFQGSTSGGGLGPIPVDMWANLSPGTVYYWRVRDYCGFSSSPSSPTWAFKSGSGGIVPQAPVLISPANGTWNLTDTVTFQWQSVPEATDGYRLYYQALNGGGYYFNSISTTLQTWVPLPDTTYDWYVQGLNSYAFGDKSATWHFSTGPFVASETAGTPAVGASVTDSGTKGGGDVSTAP